MNPETLRDSQLLQVLRCSALNAAGARSTNSTPAAPRLSASIPTAPEPAYKSRNCAPSIRGASTLNSVSRSRSLVGRVASPGRSPSVRERYVPAMMRIASSAYRKRTRPDPLQSKHARLVNPAGPLDGRRIARPRLLPSAGPRLPGLSAADGWGAASASSWCLLPRSSCAKPRGCWSLPGWACACAPSCCCPSAASLPTPTRKARRTPARAAASSPSRFAGPLANLATALVLAATFIGASGDVHLFDQPLITAAWLLRSMVWMQAGLGAAAPAARLSARLRPPAPRQLRPQARLRSRRPRRRRPRPGAGARRHGRRHVAAQLLADHRRLLHHDRRAD